MSAIRTDGTISLTARLATHGLTHRPAPLAVCGLSGGREVLDESGAVLVVGHYDAVAAWLDAREADEADAAEEREQSAREHREWQRNDRREYERDRGFHAGRRIE